jgi:tetratricopeptide (TPR) repeat protein
LAITILPWSQLACARDLVGSLQTETAVFQLCVSAQNLMSVGNYAAARDVLLQAAAKDPTSYSAAVHKDLAVCYTKLKNFDRAAAELKKLLAIDPSPSRLYEVAAMYVDIERNDEAVSCLRRYLASPGITDRYQAEKYLKQIGVRGNAQQARQALQAKNYVEAKRLLQKAATYDPSEYSSWIHAALAFVLKELGESEAAIVEGKKALQYDSQSFKCMYIIAMAYADLNQFDEAISWIQRYAALERDPVSRQQALQAAKGMADDRAQYNNPANKQPDYLDSMRENKEDIARWARERMPLKVAILPGDGVKGYRSTYPNLVKRALDTWCEASGKKIDYKLVNNKADADITVRWTTAPLDITLDHANVQPNGLTHSRTVDGKINIANIDVRTVSPFNPNEEVEPGECAHIVTHEVGHALGLGHSKLIRDIMYFRSAAHQGPPTARDRATIARLYRDYPAIGFVPKTAPAEKPPTITAPASYKPPEAPSNLPPFFMPGKTSDRDKLTPPMFVPDKNSSKDALPVFNPAGTSKPSPKKKETEATPFFTP